MQVGCYSLDLYCDNWESSNVFPDKYGHSFKEFPHNYSDELGSACRAKARKNGWKLTPDGGAICPKCNRKNDVELKGESRG